MTNEQIEIRDRMTENTKKMKDLDVECERFGNTKERDERGSILLIEREKIRNAGKKLMGL